MLGLRRGAEEAKKFFVPPENLLKGTPSLAFALFWMGLIFNIELLFCPR